MKRKPSEWEKIVYETSDKGLISKIYKQLIQLIVYKAVVPSLILDKIDLKMKTITRDKDRHYITIKGSIQEEDITIVNIFAPNIGAPQYMRQTLTDITREIDSNAIIVGDFNTPLTPMDRSSKQKINKETQILNDTLDEMDLIDIFRTFYPNAEEYTFFSSAHGSFSLKHPLFSL